MNGLNLFSKIIHKKKLEQLKNRTWELFWATGWLSGIMTTASQMPKEVDWWYWETTHDRKWYPLYRVYLSWKGEHELRITTCCFRDPTWVAGCSWPRGLVPGFDGSTIRLGSSGSSWVRTSSGGYEQCRVTIFVWSSGHKSFPIWVVSFLLLFFVFFVSFLAVLAHDTDCGAIGIDDKMRRWDANDFLHQMALSAPSPKVWTATTMLLSGCEAQWTNDQKMRSSTIWPRMWYFTGNLLNV